MGKGKKQNRWEKSLRKASLIDKLDGGWSIEEEPVHGSTIRVESDGVEVDDAYTSHDDPTVPFSVDPSKLEEGKREKTLPPPFIATRPPPVPNGSDRGKGETRPPKEQQHAPLKTEFTSQNSWAPPKVRVTMDMASHSRIPSKPNLEVVNVGERLDDTQPIIRLPHQGVPQLDKTDALPSEPLLLEETDKIPHLVSESDPGNPMDLLETEDLRCEPADLLGEKLSVGDYSAVFHIATEILSTNPNDTSAQTHLAQAKEILLRMYESKIGSMDRIPKVLLPEREIIWRDLDPKSSFILSRIDGQFSYEDILDISGLSRFETCKILSELIKNGIIE